MIYLQEIKSDIFIGSIIVLSQCFRNNPKDLPTGMSTFPIQLMIKSSDLMEHLNGFEKQLKLTQNNNLLSNIMKLSYKNINISYLNADWTSKNEESYLLKEINYFSFLLNGESGQMNENIRCNFDKTFYILFSNNSNLYEINNKQETTFNQQFIYYIILNVFYKLCPLINDIAEEIISVQVRTMNIYVNRIISINIALIFIILLLEIFIILKNRLDINYIRQIIIYLYHYDESQLKFEYEIKYLEIASKEFNLNNLILLENIKKDDDYYLSLMNNSNDILLNYNVGHQKVESLNKNEVKRNLDEKGNNKFKIGEGYEQNSKNGSILNNSMNNSSMLLFLNKKNNKDGINKLKVESKPNKNFDEQNKNKKKFKDKFKNNINSISNDKIYKETEETLELIKTNNKILPRTLFLAIYISIVLTLIFLLTISINLIDIKKKRNLWEYAINLSMNYLEKIPKVLELGITTFLTVILGTSNQFEYYPIKEYKNYQPMYMTYFTRMEKYENSELISSNIKDSIFANKLYDNYRIKKNIEFCEKDEFFESYFLDSKFWNKKLNEKDNFCIISATKGVLFFNKWIDSLDTYIEYVDLMAISTKNENEKICESGLDLEIDLILHELTYLYIDFEQGKNETDAREKFFGNENFIRMLKDMNIPFTFASGAIYSSASEDLNQLNELFSFYEMIFIIITYIFDALIFSFIIIMISYNEKNKNILYFIQKILKKE